MKNKPLHIMRMSLSELIHHVIIYNDDRITLKELADRLGKNYNTFSRQVNDTDPGAQPSALDIIPITNCLGDYSIIEHICHQVGGVFMKAPRGLRKGTNPKMNVMEFRKEFESIINALVEFVDQPSEKKRDELDYLLKKHQGDTENMRRRVKKQKFEQMELEL